MIAKLLLQTLLFVAGMGALLLIAAGTLHWPAAWVFLATMAVLGLISGIWLAKTDPALLAERMRPMMQADQPAADKKFMLVFGAHRVDLVYRDRTGSSPRTLPTCPPRCRRSAWRCWWLDRLTSCG